MKVRAKVKVKVGVKVPVKDKVKGKVHPLSDELRKGLTNLFCDS